MATVPASTRSTAFTTVSTTAGPFNIGFRLFDTDSLDVYLNGVRTTAFTISATFLDGFTDSATLTLNTAVVSGTRVIIDGALTPRREADYLPGDAGLTAKLNIELPRLWSALAEVKRDSERAVRGLVPIEASEEITVGLTVSAVTSAAQAASSAAQAALFEGPWLDNVAALLANTSLGYAAAGGNLVTAGEYVRTRAEGFAYLVAASGASDHHLTTAGGVKLYVQPGERGINVKAFGAKGDGVTDDAAAVQLAFDKFPNGTIFFPRSTGAYILGSTITLTNASGRNFQGKIVGDRAQITFTNNGLATDTDINMQRGFASYPVLNGAGGDITGMRHVPISGLEITGPLHGSSIHLANCQNVTLVDVTTINNRYGVVEECCIGTGHYNCIFNSSANAGVGLLYLGDTARVWYGPAGPAGVGSRWNDSPIFDKCSFLSNALNQTLAHILDHGSLSESVRSIGGCLFYSNLSGTSLIGTQYGILSRGGQWHSYGSNWMENVPNCIRILEAASLEGTGNVSGVAGAEPGGAYSLTRIPDGFSYEGTFTDWWFARSFITLDVTGVRGVARTGGNINQLLANGGTHIKSASTVATQKILDTGDTILTPAGTYAYQGVTAGTYINVAAQWVTWAATVGATSGAISTVTINAARFLQRGKEVQVRLDVTITNNGTGSGAVTIALPVTGLTNGGVLAGREMALTGKSLAGVVLGSVVQISAADNAYPGGTNARLVLSGVYEAS
jgi:hypothetical protein